MAKKIRDSKKDREIQKQIKAKADYSLFLLGMAFYRRFGRFINFRSKALSRR